MRTFDTVTGLRYKLSNKETKFTIPKVCTTIGHRQGQLRHKFSLSDKKFSCKDWAHSYLILVFRCFLRGLASKFDNVRRFLERNCLEKRFYMTITYISCTNGKSNDSLDALLKQRLFPLILFNQHQSTCTTTTFQIFFSQIFNG